MKTNPGILASLALQAHREMERSVAPSHAPYPSTVPLMPVPEADSTPWWSEKLLLRHFGQLALLKMYTQPSPGIVQ